MTYFFTSDYHLGHKKIIQYCKRPFKNVTLMNETIIKNHNKIVKPNDTVYFLGDFCFNNFKFYRRQLNGKFIFIMGNHDRHNDVPTIMWAAVIKHGGKIIYLTHDPVDIVEDVEINLVGHVHEHWKHNKSLNGIPVINVGVDVWKFKPVTIEEIFKDYHKLCGVQKNGFRVHS